MILFSKTGCFTAHSFLQSFIRGSLVGLVLCASTVSVQNLWAPVSAQAAIPEAFSRGFSEIVEKVQPAVVNVAVSGSAGPGSRRLPPGPFGGPPGGGPPPMPGPPGRPPGGPPGMSAGSGFIISADGYIVTNNHVVEDASEITVTMPDTNEYKAKIIGTDPKTDLAVIKIKAQNLPFIPWSTDQELHECHKIFKPIFFLRQSFPVAIRSSW